MKIIESSNQIVIKIFTIMSQDYFHVVWVYHFSFVIKIRKDQENKIYFLPELRLELHHPSKSTIHLLVAYDPSDRVVVVNTLETFSELIIWLDHIQHQMKRRHIILLAFNENTW